MVGATYEIRVAGTLPPDLIRQLRQVTVTGQEARTVMHGRFADQAALQGFLHRLSALGLELVELRHVPSPDGRPGKASP